MLWIRFCLDIVGPGFLVAFTLTLYIFVNIVIDHVHFFIATVFPNGSCLFHLDNVPCLLKENEETFRVLTWPTSSQELNAMDHLWDVGSMEAPLHQLKILKHLVVSMLCWIRGEEYQLHVCISEADIIKRGLILHNSCTEYTLMSAPCTIFDISFQRVSPFLSGFLV